MEENKTPEPPKTYTSQEIFAECERLDILTKLQVARNYWRETENKKMELEVIRHKLQMQINKLNAELQKKPE